METNNNMQKDNVSEPIPVRAPGFVNGGVGGGDTADMVTPVNGGNNVVFQNKPKKSHGMLYGMILLAILAAGGIGFGVWAMMDGNQQIVKKDEQITELRKQLTEKSEMVVDEEDATAEEDVEISDDTAGGSVNTADYIYVGEWGLKIKIPDNITVTGYMYGMMAGRTSISITGTTKGGQYLPGFADTSGNNAWLGSISRYPKGTEMSLMSPPLFVFSDEQYDYYYYHPQMATSMDENERKWESESADAIEQMLNNKENYSRF